MEQVYDAVRSEIARANSINEEKRRRMTDLLYGKALVKGPKPAQGPDPRQPTQPAPLPAGAAEAEEFGGVFEAAATFIGARAGFVFRTGPHGTGYYEEPGSQAPRTVPAP